MHGSSRLAERNGPSRPLLGADQARARELARRGRVGTRSAELDRLWWLRELGEPPARRHLWAWTDPPGPAVVYGAAEVGLMVVGALLVLRNQER